MKNTIFVLVILHCLVAKLCAIEWTPDLERVIQIVSEYTKNPEQAAVLKHLQDKKNIEGLTVSSLGKLRVTGYYTPLVYTREKAQKHAKMQGSALFKNRDGQVKLMSYRGKRGGEPLYALLGDLPRGASSMPLIAGYSAAVNSKKIPYGSVLVAEIHGKVCLLFAQDTGGRVQRNHEVDVYMGVGEKAHREALKLHEQREVSVLSLTLPDQMLQEQP
jgi:membrane-bound lytic murein transglycosylase